MNVGVIDGTGVDANTPVFLFSILSKSPPKMERVEESKFGIVLDF